MRTIILSVLLIAGAAPAADLPDGLAGAVVYTRNGHIHRVDLGASEPTNLGPGEYARWSPTGKHLAIYHKGKLYVIDAGGSDRRELASVKAQHGPPMDFAPDGAHIVHITGDHAVAMVHIDTGESKRIDLPMRPTGELTLGGIDGQRLTLRAGHHLYAVDLATGQAEQFARGCSPGVSPNGRLLMYNLGDHRRAKVRRWETAGGATLVDARTCKPDPRWDNHHWSNHDDWIAVQGEGGPREVYVFHLPSNQGYRVTFEGQAAYPDVWIKP